MVANVFHVGSDDTPSTILTKFEKWSRENGKQPYLGDWAENLQQIAGFLKAQVEAAVKVLNGGLSDVLKGADFGGTPLNVVMPFVNRYVSRVTHLFKEYQVLGGPDDNDEDQALADEKILNGRWQTSDLRKATQRAIVFACATSRGFVFTDADDTLDPQTIQVPMIDKTTGLPVVGLDLQPLTEERIIPRGDLVHWPLSALQVDVYPNDHGVKGSPWVAAHVFMSEEDIRRRWGVTEIPQDAKGATTGEARVDKLYNNDRFLWKVSHLWQKVGPDSPQGAHYVFLGTTEIHRDKKDGKDWIGTWNNKCPVVEFSDGLQAGYWGRGRHTAAKPIVKNICIAWSTVSQIGSIPGLVLGVPSDAVPSSKLANLRLLVFEKDTPQDSIDFHSAPRMPLHEYIIERGIKQIGEIYSQHAVSRGESPGSRFPAKGLDMLWKVDVMAETPTGKDYLDAFRELGEMELGEGRRVWPDSFVSRTLGENGRWQVAAFKRGEIGSNIDVQVVPNRQQHEDKDSLRKYLVTAGKEGLVDPSVVRREFGKPSKEDIHDPTLLQENNCKDEEAQIQQGGLVPTQWYDDPLFHFTFHLRAGAKRGAKAGDDEVNSRKMHVIEHLVKCPQMRMPELMRLVSQELLNEIKQMAAEQKMPPEPGMGAPTGVPSSEIEPGMMGDVGFEGPPPAEALDAGPMGPGLEGAVGP